MCVCHSCDNKLCVNPDHLWLGTHKDNVHDMHKKGRNADVRGSKNAIAKIDEAQAKNIKKLLSEGMGQSEVSRKLMVPRSIVDNIKHKKAWTHI